VLYCGATSDQEGATVFLQAKPRRRRPYLNTRRRIPTADTMHDDAGCRTVPEGQSCRVFVRRLVRLSSGNRLTCRL
jgi:hypothetical protein